MLIREYTPMDRKACLVLFNSNVPNFFASEEAKDFEAWLDQLVNRRTESDYYYVVEKDNQVIACGGFYLPPGEQTACLVWGMVANAFHKQGIGRTFLTYRINQIRTRRPEAVLELDTTQHSFPFFEKLGFTVTQITKDYYAPGLDRYDMVGSQKVSEP